MSWDIFFGMKSSKQSYSEMDADEKAAYLEESAGKFERDFSDVMRQLADE